MREIAISLGTLCAALVLIAVVVFAGRDAALFVPPPEAVAEGFSRELGSGRYDLARRYLSRATHEKQTAAAIERRFAPVKRRLGAIDGAEAAELSREREAAAAVCELKGEGGAVTLTFALTREQGLWVIDSWQAGGEPTP